MHLSCVTRLALGFGLLLHSTGCSLAPRHRPGERAPRVGDEIVVCGQMFHTGTRVVLWTDPGGYDAYRVECRFTPDRALPSAPAYDGPARYGSRRRGLPDELAARVQTQGWRLEDLQKQVSQFVLHYDACGSSRRCFEVLHDVRGLSVHFMLDLDGTIYQTLDAKERAWHAGAANDRSIGVEIANIGALADARDLETWYFRDRIGYIRTRFPASMTAPDFLTRGFVGRPARNELIAGEINGQRVQQYDFTPEQYAALAHLTATLCRVFPMIPLEYPRGTDQQLRMNALNTEELADYRGLLGHWHVTKDKIDPGPAFDWERLLHDTRRCMR